MDKEVLALLTRIAESVERVEAYLVETRPLIEHAQKLFSMSPAQRVKALMSKNGKSTNG